MSGTIIAGEKAEAETERLPLIGYETFGQVKAIFKSRSSLWQQTLVINHHPNGNSDEKEGDRSEIFRMYNYPDYVMDQVQGIREKNSPRIATMFWAWMSRMVDAEGLDFVHFWKGPLIFIPTEIHHLETSHLPPSLSRPLALPYSVASQSLQPSWPGPLGQYFHLFYSSCSPFVPWPFHRTHLASRFPWIKLNCPFTLCQLMESHALIPAKSSWV